MKPLERLTEDEFAEVVRHAVAMPNAPDAMIRAAVALFPDPSKPTAADRGRRVAAAIRAVLTFDSWGLAPLAMAVRSMPSDTRHLLFSAEGRDIDLRIRPSATGFELAGQILGPDETGTIELNGASQHVAELDELGGFRLDGVAPGRYQATLRLADAIVELASIDVGGRAP